MIWPPSRESGDRPASGPASGPEPAEGVERWRVALVGHTSALTTRITPCTQPAFTYALLYKCRWKVEPFFKCIKQRLRIKTFFGTSENAVKAQVWIAISVYVLVARTWCPKDSKRLGVA